MTDDLLRQHLRALGRKSAQSPRHVNKTRTPDQHKADSGKGGKTRWANFYATHPDFTPKRQRSKSALDKSPAVE